MKKSGHNKFAGYQYFELGDFLLPIQQIFNEIGLCGIVSFTKEVATLRIYDTESSEFIEFTSPMGSAALKGCHEVQNIGAVETYQRRYLYVAAMEIVEHDAIEAVTGKDDLKDIAMEVIALIEAEKIAESIKYLEDQNLGADKAKLWKLLSPRYQQVITNFKKENK
jgi:hypothetical protein